MPLAVTEQGHQQAPIRQEVFKTFVWNLLFSRRTSLHVATEALHREVLSHSSRLSSAQRHGHLRALAPGSLSPPRRAGSPYRKPDAWRIVVFGNPTYFRKALSYG